MTRYIIITLILLFGAGCANVNKPYPERSYYQFEVRYSGHKATPIKGTVLGIKRLSVSPGSQGLEFIYRTGEFKFQSDFYNQFFRPPGALITEEVTRWFANAGVFEDVLGQLSQAFPNYVIEGNIVSLYGDYRNSSAPSAVMEIQFFLLKLTDDADNPIVVTSGTYSVSKPISSRDPKALMLGWNMALEDILGHFTSDVKNSMPGQAPNYSKSE